MTVRVAYSEHRQIGPSEWIELEALDVPISNEFPRGVRLSYNYFVRRAEGAVRILGIDNAHGKGLHEHFRGEEVALPERHWRQTRAYFFRRLAEIRGRVE